MMRPVEGNEKYIGSKARSIPCPSARRGCIHVGYRVHLQGPARRRGGRGVPLGDVAPKQMTDPKERVRDAGAKDLKEQKKKEKSNDTYAR